MPVVIAMIAMFSSLGQQLTAEECAAHLSSYWTEIAVSEVQTGYYWKEAKDLSTNATDLTVIYGCAIDTGRPAPRMRAELLVFDEGRCVVGALRLNPSWRVRVKGYSIHVDSFLPIDFRSWSVKSPVFLSEWEIRARSEAAESGRIRLENALRMYTKEGRDTFAQQLNLRNHEYVPDVVTKAEFLEFQEVSVLSPVQGPIYSVNAKVKIERAGRSKVIVVSLVEVWFKDRSHQHAEVWID